MFDNAFINFDKHFLMKKYVSGKLLLVMSYIRLYASYSGKVLLSIDFLAETLGYTPNRKEGKINEHLVRELEWLREQNYIDYSIDLSVSKNHSKCFLCMVSQQNNIFDMQADNGKIRNFVQLTEEEFEKIVKCTYKRKDWLLSVFLHMKKRICINGISTDSAYCFAALDTIAKDAGNNVSISKSSVANVIDILVECGLLFEHITGSYVDCHGKLKQAVNYYALSKAEMKHTECDSLAKSYLRDKEGLDIDEFIH